MTYNLVLQSRIVSGQELKASLLRPRAERPFLPDSLHAFTEPALLSLHSPGQPVKWC